MRNWFVSVPLIVNRETSIRLGPLSGVSLAPKAPVRALKSLACAVETPGPVAVAVGVAGACEKPPVCG